MGSKLSLKGDGDYRVENNRKVWNRSMDKHKILLSNRWATDLLTALGLDATRNRRVIIDCEVGQPVKIYLENYDDERLYNVRMPPLEIVRITHSPSEGGEIVIARTEAQELYAALKPIEDDISAITDHIKRWERADE